MNYFLTWEEAFLSGASLSGGKGWNLGRLCRYGFNIPKGGVLAAQVYHRYMKYNGLQNMADNIASFITTENMGEADVKNSLEQLRRKILGGSMPPDILKDLKDQLYSLGGLEKSWAVRSSAVGEDSENNSFAGIHDSFLNVNGIDDILSAVKGCYASLWSQRAIVYRKRMKLSNNVAAVVIMEMVKAQAAGVGFTCDIQSGRLDRMIINANFGLGESVVNGSVDPDIYYLDMDVLNSRPRIVERKIGSKKGITVLNGKNGTTFMAAEQSSSDQVLSDENIIKLGAIMERVFDALGNSEQQQDVEWVYDGRDFILVQSRPVTIMPRKTFPALQNRSDVWSNGNYRDAVPMVQSPLNRRLMKSIIDNIHYKSFTVLDYQLPVGIQFSRFFKGRLYCNLSAYQWALYDCMGSRPDGFNMFWGGHQPSIDIGDLKPRKGFEERTMKFGALINQARQNSSNIWEKVSASIQKLTGNGMDDWENQDFILGYDQLSQATLEFISEFNLLAAVGSMPVIILLQTLSRYFQGRELMLLNALMVGSGEGITSADQGYRLLELSEIAVKDPDACKYFGSKLFDPPAWEKLPETSQFKRSFRGYIKEYGHRAVYELDIINPRWNEDPTYLLDYIKNGMNNANLHKLQLVQKEKQEKAWLEIKEKIPVSEHSSIIELVKECQAGAAVREKTKSVLAELMEAYRVIAKKIGLRFCQGGIIEDSQDVFFCTWSELFSVLSNEWDGSGLKILIDERKVWLKEMEELAPPDMILGDTPRFKILAVSDSARSIHGVPVAAGKAAGSVRLVNHPDQGSKLQKGEVMVVPSTDPAWTPLFLRAGALVMETGGFLSHGSIVAREYGIPAVANIPGIMSILKDGQTILVDGDNGKIFLNEDLTNNK